MLVILSFKGILVTTLTLQVKWRHLSCDHVFAIWGFLQVVNLNRPSISHGFWDIKLQMYWGHDLDLLGSRGVMCHVTTGFPMRGFLLVVYMNGPCIYLARLSRYWASKISGSRSWPFGVTLRHLSRDHWIRNIGFPIGGQFVLTVYLISHGFWDIKLQRYWPYWGHDFDLLGSRDVMCHVTTGFPMCGFLLVVNVNGPCISHGCRDIKLQRSWPILMAKKLTAHAS